MKSNKPNTEEDSKSLNKNEEPNELNKLVKITIAQDKVLKKMIEEIKKSSKDK